MKKTDYKFWYIRRDDNVHISEAGIRFYEGEITTENERDAETGLMLPVTRYRRSARLQKGQLSHLGNKPIKKEDTGDDVVVYTPKDFGIIATDDELRIFLDKELRKDKSRQPIKEQQ